MQKTANLGMTLWASSDWNSSYVSDFLNLTVGAGEGTDVSPYSALQLIDTELGKKQDRLTESQKSAADSGITSELVTKYNGYESEISGKQSKLKAGAGISIADDGTISVSFADGDSEEY